MKAEAVRRSSHAGSGPHGEAGAALRAPGNVTQRRDRRDSRWDEHRRARREQLVQATLSAVGRHGAGVGMDEIAAEIGQVGDRVGALGRVLRDDEAVDLGLGLQEGEVGADGRRGHLVRVRAAAHRRPQLREQPAGDLAADGDVELRAVGDVPVGSVVRDAHATRHLPERDAVRPGLPGHRQPCLHQRRAQVAVVVRRHPDRLSQC